MFSLSRRNWNTILFLIRIHSSSPRTFHAHLLFPHKSQCDQPSTITSYDLTTWVATSALITLLLLPLIILPLLLREIIHPFRLPSTISPILPPRRNSQRCHTTRLDVRDSTQSEELPSQEADSSFQPILRLSTLDQPVLSSSSNSNTVLARSAHYVASVLTSGGCPSSRTSRSHQALTRRRTPDATSLQKLETLLAQALHLESRLSAHQKGALTTTVAQTYRWRSHCRTRTTFSMQRCLQQARKRVEGESLKPGTQWHRRLHSRLIRRLLSPHWSLCNHQKRNAGVKGTRHPLFTAHDARCQTQKPIPQARPCVLTSLKLSQHSFWREVHSDLARLSRGRLTSRHQRKRQPTL